MYKTLGVILLTAACIYYIYMMIYERREKLRNIKEIKKAVVCFEHELSFSMPEIAVLCETASSRTDCEISRIFSDMAEVLRQDKNTDFYTAWEKVRNGKELFNIETENLLRGFFGDLGKKSLEIELSNIERVQKSLEEQEKHEEKKYAEERKLICTLGAAFCATVIIIAI